MRIEVRAEPFQPWEELARYEQAQGELAGRFGATCAFAGTMRDFNEADTVSAMTLEHYPGMTERELTRIAEEATGRWQLLDVLIIHRVGEIRPADPIVLVATWSAHRKEAFESARHLMEVLKSSVPFWKKEQTAGGSRWVEKNTPGY